MTRLTATIHTDVRLQMRNGFYLVTAFLIAVWSLFFWRMPNLELQAVIAGMVLGNLMISTFYFMAALVLLEKSEGTLEAQMLSPLRDYEYLLSKLVTLIALATVENLAIVVLVYGFRFNLLLLAAGIALASALFSMAGFLAVARHDSINSFLFPSILVVMLLELPLLDYFGIVKSWLFYLHPLQAPLVLIQAAFEPMPAWKIVYGVVVSLFCLDMTLHLGQRTLRRFLTRQPGDA